MSNENRHEASGFGVVGGSHDCNDIQKKSNTELLDETIRTIETQSAEEMDVDAIMEKLALLQERAPVPMDHTPSEILADIKLKHPLLIEERNAGKDDTTLSYSREVDLPRQMTPQLKRRSRFARRIAVCVLAVGFCLVVTANALGFNPIQAFLEWADGIVQIYSDPSGIMELPDDDPSQYHSLKEALEAYDMAPECAPDWIPEDYRLYAVDVLDTGSLVQCSAGYESERGELLIRAIRFENADWNGRTERNNDGVEYVVNGITYYLVSNLELSKAGWEYEDIAYVISGQVTEQELKNMIDSIAEGEN